MPLNKKGKPADKTGASKKPAAKSSSLSARKASHPESKAKKAPASERVSASKIVKKPPAVSKEKPVLRKVKIEEAPLGRDFAAVRLPHPPRFQAQAVSQPAIADSSDLPLIYGEDTLVAMVRDPWWIFTYWEASPDNLKKGRAQFKGTPCRSVLRLHDITEVEFNGHNSHFFKDHQVQAETGSFYLNVWEPNRVYIVELGLVDNKGRFVMLLRSNAVRTPRAVPSPDWGKEWARFGPVFEEIFRLSGGGLTILGKSSEQILGIHAGFPSSPGMGSPSSPWGGSGSIGGGGLKKRGFFLWAETELILYGGTEPDAKLTVAGKPVKLRPDGTFSLRFALPDGEQNLRVHAVSADDQEERSITPVVTKKTL